MVPNNSGIGGWMAQEHEFQATRVTTVPHGHLAMQYCSHLWRPGQPGAKGQGGGGLRWYRIRLQHLQTGT